MPPARRTPPPVDPTPLLVEVWNALALALPAEPDPERRQTLSSALTSELIETRDLLASPHHGPAAASLEGYLRAGTRSPSTATAVDLQTALRDTLAALDTTRTEVVTSAAGPIERRVLLEERLLRAVALGRRLSEPLVPDRPVLRHCIRLLARVLAERAPGRSVELRVPPHVAVQCVEGPRHTRGTPPNVVEADPLPFLDVAFGLRGWTETVTSGRIRASGERADLRPWLPLLDQGETAG